MHAIRTEGLTKQYKSITAVDCLELTVNEGELFALLGVNGAGKTTAIKLLTCLTRPTCGDAFILGHSITKEAASVKRIIGVSPQETAVASNLTVAENLQLMCGTYGLSKAESDKRLSSLIERFSLASVLERKAGKLSGGWQRRLSIAMALVSEPKVLFLDEPTLGLDVIARSELWDCIRMLKGNTTVILTTHYMEEAEALSDRIGIMRDGRLIATGTSAELKAQANAERFEDAFISIVKGAAI